MTRMPTGLSRQSRVLSGLVALLMLVALAATVTIAVGLRRQAGERAQQDTSRLATVLSEQSARMLEAVEQVLAGVERDMHLAGTGTAERLQAVVATESTHRDLAARISGLPQADGVVIFNADGIEINSNRSWPVPPILVADRSYFRAMRIGAPGAQYISEPVISRATGHQAIYIARRISAPDGGFLGVLAGAVQVRYLEEFYAAIGLPAGMAVTVLRHDGTVLASAPPGRTIPAQSMPAASPWYRTLAAGGGTYWSSGWLDSDERLVAVRPVPGFPLVVDVNMTRRAVYAAWRQQVATLAVATVCALLCLLLLLRALVAQFRRLETVQAALRKKSVLLETTLAHMDQGLVMVTAERTVGVFNDRARQLLDLPAGVMREGVPFDAVLDGRPEPDEGSGLGLPPLLPPEDCAADRKACERRGPNGTVLEIRSVPLAGGGLVRTYTDITERRLAEERILHAAQHDALTGLPNRAAFSEALAGAMVRADESGSGVAVLLIDLDRFKLVNDTLGHAAGDDVLQQLAGRMRTVVRENDTLARIGGDGFALVLPGMGSPDAAIVTAGRLRDAVNAPCFLPQGTASVGMSIGIACYPLHGRRSAELLNHADLALYRAKAAGRDQCCVFDGELDAIKHDELILENAFRSALQEEQFVLAYQPVWDIRAQRIVGAEALVRWNHPTKGMIAPASFIPLAERTGQIVELGRWVMATACREALSWAIPITVAVNVAPAQLRCRGIADEVGELLARTGLPASRLVLEVTEGQLLEETEQMAITLTALRELGVRLALDDFGTGFSSLSTLRAFPFSDIKIDRSFTRSVVQDERSRSLVEAILQVCRVLNLDCVAEGIETSEQLALLQSLGCSHGQGYLIGRPEPPATIRRALWRAAAGERQEVPMEQRNAMTGAA